MAIAGDGGFQMSLQELSTLMDHGVNKLLVVVMLNGRLGRVQNESWGAEDAEGDLPYLYLTLTSPNTKLTLIKPNSYRTLH